MKIALGMSGGVDSSVSAKLLLDAGYDVTGVYLECWRAPGCRSEEDRKDALAVALQLGIPFQVLDFKDAYKDKVVEYFFQEYEAGRTPNPDVMCNKEIKFGLFYDWAISSGFDFVATGHYAQITSTFINESEQFNLSTSKDEHKDQTYFLYLLREEQLSHILFPIGHLTKPEVRALARDYKIAVANKKDSVGICFIGDIDVHAFLKERLGEKPGDVIDLAGNVIGTHQGLWFYTIGQRHGFQIFDQTKIQQANGEVVNRHNVPPFYVISKNSAKNQLIVGFGSETLTNTFLIESTHWLAAMDQTRQLFVRIRHTGELIPCTLDNSRVELNKAIRGVAEGQAAVFYQRHSSQHEGFICLGGGVISFTKHDVERYTSSHEH